MPDWHVCKWWTWWNCSNLTFPWNQLIEAWFIDPLSVFCWWIFYPLLLLSAGSRKELLADVNIVLFVFTSDIAIVLVQTDQRSISINVWHFAFPCLFCFNLKIVKLFSHWTERWYSECWIEFDQEYYLRSMLNSACACMCWMVRVCVCVHAWVCVCVPNFQP